MGYLNLHFVLNWLKTLCKMLICCIVQRSSTTLTYNVRHILRYAVEIEPFNLLFWIKSFFFFNFYCNSWVFSLNSSCSLMQNCNSWLPYTELQSQKARVRVWISLFIFSKWFLRRSDDTPSLEDCDGSVERFITASASPGFNQFNMLSMV